MSSLKLRIARIKTCEYWTIAYRRRNAETALCHQNRAEGFLPLKQKKYVTQADPFLYKHKGQNYLFYEVQDLTDMKGTLWCRNLDNLKEKPVLVLEEMFHLSYPQIFRYGKYTYMVPETKQAGEVRLYKCERFPKEWSLVQTLWKLPAVDTTFLLPENITATEEKETEVFAFAYTEDRLKIYACPLLEGHFYWEKAKEIYCSEKNRTLRPGGGFLREGNKLLRPAQDCGDYYGKELIFYEVTELSKKGFAEREYSRITPDNIVIPGLFPVGIHTYNRNEDYEVIDILHRQISWDVVFQKLKWWLWNRFWKKQ